MCCPYKFHTKARPLFQLNTNVSSKCLHFPLRRFLSPAPHPSNCIKTPFAGTARSTPVQPFVHSAASRGTAAVVLSLKRLPLYTHTHTQSKALPTKPTPQVVTPGRLQEDFLPPPSENSLWYNLSTERGTPSPSCPAQAMPWGIQF